MNRAEYFRLYTDENGESHFEELELELSPVDFAPPAAPLNIAKFYPAKESLWVGAPSGWAGENPHPTPQRQIFCALKGECEVTASDGEVRRFSAGSVILLEDTWGRGHSTRITSKEGALFFVTVLSDEA